MHIMMNFDVVERVRRGGADGSTLGPKGAQERGNPTKPYIIDIYIRANGHIQNVLPLISISS